MTRKPLLPAVALALILTGCSTKGTSSGSSSESTDIKTDFGVTDSEITLGALSDMSGPFKANALGSSAGFHIWADEINENGGVCNRDVAISEQDTGYKPDIAVSLYQQMAPNVLGFIQTTGSPIQGAIKPRLQADNMLALLEVGASAALDTDTFVLTGQSLDIEVLNGLSYLSEQDLLSDGDSLGVVFIDNDGGQNTLTGAKAYAESHGLSLVELPMSSTDTDLTTTVTKLKDANVSAIVTTVSSAAGGSLILQNKAQGLDVPILGTSVVFAKTLLEDPEVTAGLSNYYQVVSYAPLGSSGAAQQTIAEAYAATYSDPPERSIVDGYVKGLAFQAILEQACENGDMTRAGIKSARTQVTNVDTAGLTGKFDLSDPGSPATRAGFIVQTDPAEPIGLSAITDLVVYPEAEDYKTPYES